MNNIIKKAAIVLSCLVLCFVYTSCDDFLDKQEDEKLTFDKIWETGANTEKYWYGTMSFISHELGGYVGDVNPWLGASDEATITYNRGYQSINFGSWNPTNIPYASNEGHDKYYKGIRECNIFLANIHRLSDPTVKQNDIDKMIGQCRFARAYYYFCMMRIYGPVYLMGDEIVDATTSAASLVRPRNTWDECVDYVVSELEACIAHPGIKDEWPDAELGLATKGACQALIARLKLYSARDLFNGNTLYREVKNPVTDNFPELSGVNLFPQEYKASKWLEAAEAALVVINNPLYKLYREGKGDPYADYYGVTNKNWNSELIWTTGYKGSRANISMVTAPTSLPKTHYGGIGPTQQQVDAYAMVNGKYPITGYTDNGASPIVDNTSGYNPNEFGKTTWDYPAWGGTKSYSVTTPNMYRDREPRFYVNVFWGDSYWHHGSNKTLTSYAKGGNGNVSHDYPKSGYAINRFYDHTADSGASQQQWGSITFPTIRLGEIYLNFIEAVLECKKRGVSMPANYETKAMEVWADLRDRAGLKPITEIYPGSTTEELIELCRKERRVELSFENHRYFDTRTWMIAEQTDGGPMYGMNVTVPTKVANVTPDEFWQRRVFETRVFKKNHYLFPWSQREIERNSLLTQNYGW